MLSSFLLSSMLAVTSSAAAPQSGDAPAGATRLLSPGCATTIRDQSTGDCIRAASVPAIGKLYPLSSDLFVDSASGYVGLGTTAPTSRWHLDDPSTAPGLTSAHITNRSSDMAMGLMVEALDMSTPSSIGILTQTWSKAGTGLVGCNGSWGLLFGSGVSGATFGAPTGLDTAAVFGVALDDVRDDFGVFGLTYSKGDGHGVLGYHASVLGEGAGVHGITYSTEQDAKGVSGEVSSPSPGANSAAVYGLNNGTGALGIGVVGLQAGSGYGVYGRAYGAGYGVVGVSGSGGTAVIAFGDMSATGVKSFVQPHPTDASKEIRFVCLEGNESGTYFRGSARLENGRAQLLVPEDFRLVSEPSSITVQVTGRGPGTLWVERIDLDELVVRGERDIEFDYFVNGVRRGFASVETIRENRGFVPEFREVPFGAQYPRELRELLVENGTLHADYTPNEATALRMGWTLRDAAAPRRARRQMALRTSDGHVERIR